MGSGPSKPCALLLLQELCMLDVRQENSTSAAAKRPSKAVPMAQGEGRGQSSPGAAEPTNW